MQRSVHIAIAGGGIIGLSCALALRHRGFTVTVLETGMATREASWAAGGMLAAEDPENPPALLPLSRYSRSLYARFLEEIKELSGQHVSLRSLQAIQVLEGSESASIGTLLSREEALALVPGLGDASRRYLLLEEASLDPRELCTALRGAVLTAGVMLREQEQVLSVEFRGEQCFLTTTRGTLTADTFLNCCGAWAGELQHSAAVAPCKGQMFVIAQPPGTPLTRVLRSPHIYLIPRGNGRIVVGATVEEAGYSKTVESAALSRLRRLATTLWPPAMKAPEIESWAGLRPATPDGLPVLGRGLPENGSGWIASGHFRNGILLAPGTAQVMADLICGIAPAVDLAPFALHRPSVSTACDKHFAAAL